jgi:hypothetical protein
MTTRAPGGAGTAMSPDAEDGLVRGSVRSRYGLAVLPGDRTTVLW